MLCLFHELLWDYKVTMDFMSIAINKNWKAPCAYFKQGCHFTNKLWHIFRLLTVYLPPSEHRILLHVEIKSEVNSTWMCQSYFILAQVERQQWCWLNKHSSNKFQNSKSCFTRTTHVLQHTPPHLHSHKCSFHQGDQTEMGGETWLRKEEGKENNSSYVQRDRGLSEYVTLLLLPKIFLHQFSAGGEWHRKPYMRMIKPERQTLFCIQFQSCYIAGPSFVLDLNECDIHQTLICLVIEAADEAKSLRWFIHRLTRGVF